MKKKHWQITFNLKVICFVWPRNMKIFSLAFYLLWSSSTSVGVLQKNLYICQKISQNKWDNSHPLVLFPKCIILTQETDFRTLKTDTPNIINTRKTEAYQKSTKKISSSSGLQLKYFVVYLKTFTFAYRTKHLSLMTWEIMKTKCLPLWASQQEKVINFVCKTKKMSLSLFECCESLNLNCPDQIPCVHTP